MNFKIRCDNVQCRIETGPIPPEVTEQLVELCSYKIDGAEHMPMVVSGKWDGIKRFYQKRYRKFPAGLAFRVVNYLRQQGHRVAVDWQFDEVGRVRYPEISPEFAQREYQAMSTEVALEEKRCMIRVATGGGKTVIAGHLISRVGMKAIFLVHTKDLLYQAKDMFSAMFGAELVGQIGDGVVQPSTITICTVQTASRALDVKYEKNDYIEEDDWKDDTYVDSQRKIEILDTLYTAGVVIMDECHRVAAPTALDVMQSITGAEYRFGLSASPWRDDGADLALEAVFGRVAVSIPASDLIQQGFLVQPLIRMLKVAPIYFPKKTSYHTIYKDYIVENEERNALGVEHAARMVERGLPTLILVRHIKHGKNVQKLLSERLGRPVPFLSGSDDSATRNAVLNDLRNSNLDVLVATTIADEGLDVKPLAGLVLLGAGKSSVRALQRIGRVLRTHPGKTHAEVIDFEDQSKFLLSHSQRRYQMYATESEFVITDV